MSDNFFGDKSESIRGKIWNWMRFKTTKNFPVSDNLLDHVVGQDKALEECKLALEEWIHKISWMTNEKWFDSWIDPNKPKPNAKKFLPSGPFITLLGDAGTGKSLIGRALPLILTELYEKYDIKLMDVLCWKNKVIPSNPLISIVPAGEGHKITQKLKGKLDRKRKLMNWFLKGLAGFAVSVAGVFFGAGFYFLHKAYMQWVLDPNIQAMTSLFDWMLIKFVEIGGSMFLPPIMILVMMFVWIFLRGSGMMGGGGGKSVGGAQASDAPKVIVNNSTRIAPFIDATGHGSAQLFGSITWDPLQSGGMGTPEHQRVNAGEVHQAFMGILYIDEIKNLKPEEVTTLLTVLEDNQLSIAMRGSQGSSSGSAAFAVGTEPVPCMTFLVAAGNFDSIPLIHPALMSRLEGYGQVVRMHNEMDNSVANRRKYVQFIAQECRRYRLPPFTREACKEIINIGRRKSNYKDKLTTKFRPMISIIKTASILARKEGQDVVDHRHVVEAHRDHCKSIQQQRLEDMVERGGKFLEIDTTGSKLGKIHGLAVYNDRISGSSVGTVSAVQGHLTKKSKLADNKIKGFYKVTGIAKPDKAKYITGSVEKVRSVILAKYRVDIAQNYLTHLDFAQSHGVDGPSAGVTMALVLCSLIDGKPLRQDVAVTGEINIPIGDDIRVTAIGGVDAKIRAAQKRGFKKVVIPQKNYEHSINPEDYKIEVVGASTLDEYLKECMVE